MAVDQCHRRGLLGDFANGSRLDERRLDGLRILWDTNNPLRVLADEIGADEHFSYPGCLLAGHQQRFENAPAE